MFHSITFNSAKDVHVDDPFAYACKLPAIKSRKGHFEFKPGLNVIVGENGSGKSTLLHTIARAMTAHQSGKSVVTETALRELSYGLPMVMTKAFDVKHDGQPVMFLDPREKPGLRHGQFDDDFMTLGIQSLQARTLSSGQTSEFRFRDIMMTFLEPERFPSTIPATIQERGVNDLWKGLIREHKSRFLSGSIDKGQPTILLDEPDTGLDARRALTIWSILTSPEVISRFQIIVVSHSPLAMMAKDANIIEMENGYADECKKLTDEFGVVDHFSAIRAHFKAQQSNSSNGETPKSSARPSHRKLTRNLMLALEHLQKKEGEWTSPTEVGREVGTLLGKPGRHSSFGSPLCKKLVSLGLAERHPDKGWYRATEDEGPLR